MILCNSIENEYSDEQDTRMRISRSNEKGDFRQLILFIKPIGKIRRKRVSPSKKKPDFPKYLLNFCQEHTSQTTNGPGENFKKICTRYPLKLNVASLSISRYFINYSLKSAMGKFGNISNLGRGINWISRNLPGYSIQDFLINETNTGFIWVYDFSKIGHWRTPKKK